MRESRLFTQDPAQGLVGQMLGGIAWTTAGLDYARITAAIAYATEQGVKRLTDQLSATDGWEGKPKRWLVSLDFGHTEPRALELLADLDYSEVRIPNGGVVVRRSSFSPVVSFHPKLYVFDGARKPLATSAYGIFVGSANLSVSGLVAGCEAGRADRWIAPIAVRDVAALKQTRRQLVWLDAAWASADPLANVLADYRRKRRRRPRRDWVPPEERAEANSLYAPTGDTEVKGDLSVLLRNARALWVETWILYHNLGSARPGNQLDLRAGTRVFFGLSPDRVPRNTKLGPVTMQYQGFPLVTKNLRFGNNMMDKLNLPVPATEGPATGYDNTYLLFERLPEGAPDGRDLFRVRRLTRRQLDARRRQAVHESRSEMTGGREYGLLF